MRARRLRSRTSATVEPELLLDGALSRLVSPGVLFASVFPAGLAVVFCTPSAKANVETDNSSDSAKAVVNIFFMKPSLKFWMRYSFKNLKTSDPLRLEDGDKAVAVIADIEVVGAGVDPHEFRLTPGYRRGSVPDGLLENTGRAELLDRSVVKIRNDHVALGIHDDPIGTDKNRSPIRTGEGTG